MKITSTDITLHDMRFYAKHGALPQERIVGGEYLVNITIRLAHNLAAETDNLDDTVNYAEIYEAVSQVMLTPSALIEHVAGRIARTLLTDFGQIIRAEVMVTKIHPPMPADMHAASATVVAER